MDSAESVHGKVMEIVNMKGLGHWNNFLKSSACKIIVALILDWEIATFQYRGIQKKIQMMVML